jgi:lysophospholipase L1-like esterase
MIALGLASALAGGGCSSDSSPPGAGGTESGGATPGSGGQPNTGGTGHGGGAPGSGGQGAAGPQDGSALTPEGGASGGAGAGLTDATAEREGGGAGQEASANIRDGAGGERGDAPGSPRDSGAEASNTAFAPCPTGGAPCLIMPLGDSITDGFPFEAGGYRVELFHQTVQNSQLVSFVGSLANGPVSVDGRTFPRNHEGHTGFTIDNEQTVGRTGISGLTDQAIATTHPHIVLLMIGTNDVDLSVDLANAPARLGALVDRITADAPNALVVVAELVPTQTDAENVRFQAYNGAIPAIVAARAVAGKHVASVDMYAAFTANPNFKTVLMNDNLHPNAAGYAVLGDAWYAAIRSYLPSGP